MKEHGTIVIGVDGSAQGRRALAWAVTEARVRGARCQLIHAWSYGVAAAGPYVGDALPQLAEDAETLLETELDFAKQSGVPVAGRCILGSAARALVEASETADLLVVGSRGRGGLASALLGSVSTACVHHSHCPVVVVPPPDRVTAAVPDPEETSAVAV